jgi:hypothetical protein
MAKLDTKQQKRPMPVIMCLRYEPLSRLGCLADSVALDDIAHCGFALIVWAFSTLASGRGAH